MPKKIDLPKCCPTDFVIHTLSTRWTMALLRALAIQPLRPSELTKSLPGISAKTLTQRLRELEQVNVIARTSFQEIPPRVVYELTERGKDLMFVLDALEELGNSWQRTLPAYQIWGPNEQCAHCYMPIGPHNNPAPVNSSSDGPDGKDGSTEVELEVEEFDVQRLPHQAMFS
jgi:DNA-binding HxlR family transcriptional regulator